MACIKHAWKVTGLKSGTDGTFEKRKCDKCQRVELKKIDG